MGRAEGDVGHRQFFGSALEASKAEIEDFDVFCAVVFFDDEDVFGFEIAMEYAFGMCATESLGDFGKPQHHRLQWRDFAS